jgi:hypothetical protein
MSKITKDATMILDHDDIAEILTEEICRYNAFAGLRVEGVEMNAEGNFVLALAPVPAQQPTVKAVA